VVIVALARYLEQGDEFDRLLALLDKETIKLLSDAEKAKRAKLA